MSNLLEIKGLYAGYEQDVNILQGIDLTVAEGEAVGIIGLNGSGKSTLGKAVMNLLPYRKGSIVFNGQHIEDKSTHELAQLGIALMHQGGVVFPNLSVWQNLQLAWGDKADKAYFEQLKDIIPLLRRPKKELVHTIADKLSGGQRHELALAMTLARHPKSVILDEPSAGMSPKAMEELYAQGEFTSVKSAALFPKNVSQIKGILVKLREHLKISMLLVEQNIMVANSFCNRCVILEQGRVKLESIHADIKEVERLLFQTNK